jgi:hypothetical protein
MGDSDTKSFIEAALTAGSILTGFVGTFLNFRIQREASYYRSPENPNTDQQHFGASFFLIIFAAVSSAIFGVALPLFALMPGHYFVIQPEMILAGILGSIVIVIAYFFAELFHYRIIFKQYNGKWIFNPDREGWRREFLIVALALSFFAITFFSVIKHMNAVKTMAICLGVAGGATGVIAAYHWLESAKIPVVPSWGDFEPVETKHKAMGLSLGTSVAFTQSAVLNRTAARWTAASVLLSSISGVLGNV